jgi:tetraacyldisaccharide 4'-kinase
VPVIVVGNITLGGTGKTPMLMALVERLQREGYRPGVISRGYGRSVGLDDAIVIANQNSTAAELGDEPFMIHQRCVCPLAIGADRFQVAKTLLEAHDCDVLISDDGLQHYHLNRQIEIALVDGERGLGNGFCLPAGPLREPPGRLRSVDFVVVNGLAKNETPLPTEKQFLMSLAPTVWHKVGEQTQIREFSSFQQTPNLHAIAGIGNPKRFFDVLRAHNLQFSERAFPDHYDYKTTDLPQGSTVLMTEKDAVKCAAFKPSKAWFLRVDAVLPEPFWTQILDKLAKSASNTEIRESSL